MLGMYMDKGEDDVGWRLSKESISIGWGRGPLSRNRQATPEHIVGSASSRPACIGDLESNGMKCQLIGRGWRMTAACRQGSNAPHLAVSTLIIVCQDGGAIYHSPSHFRS